jgi:hypothetical protein
VDVVRVRVSFENRVKKIFKGFLKLNFSDEKKLIINFLKGFATVLH